MNKYKPQIIVCPQCKSIIGKYDGRSTIKHICKCKTCNKRIIYHVGTGKVEIKPLPQRTCSSGITFC